MKAFNVWRPDYDEDREYRKPVSASNAAAAAEAVCERNFSNWDYEMFSVVSVAEVGSDGVTEYQVEVESTPHFYASVYKPTPAAPDEPQERQS